MSRDSSAGERARLSRRIAHVEERGDEFVDLSNAHERSLERFVEEFRAACRVAEASLHESAGSGNRAAREELAVQQELLAHAERYAHESFEELEWARSRVRHSLEDERQDLMRERDGLPWE